MEQRAFGLTGRRVAVVGQGTWQMEEDDHTSVLAALRRGLDLGMTHIDTAEMYGRGAVERIVAEAIRGRSRDELFLVSKVLPENTSHRDTRRACEASLARLGTDHLDLYLIHWPGRHPVAGTIAAFEELREAGKIRAWGVSNFDVPELEEALAIAGPERIACNQVLYHLGERAIEHRVLPWCEKHGIAVVAYSPYGQGDFPRPRSAGGRLLAEIAEQHGATPRQVALRFLLRRPNTFVIPKSSDVGHTEENAGAGELVITAADELRIHAAFPLGRPPRELPSL